MPTVRDQIQLARINTMKKRTAEAWHQRCCPRCAERRAAGELGAQGGGGIVGLLRALNALPDAVDDEPGGPPKHAH